MKKILYLSFLIAISISLTGCNGNVTTETPRQKELRTRLANTVIPEVDFVEATISDVLGFFSVGMQPWDSTMHPENRRFTFSFILNPRGLSESDLPTITYQAKDIIALKLLDEVMKIAQLTYRIEDNWIIVGKKYYSPRIEIASDGMAVADELKSIVIPEVDFLKAKPSDIMKFFKTCSVEYGSEKLKSGMISFKAKQQERSVGVTMRGHYLSLHEMLSIISQVTGIGFDISSSGVDALYETVDKRLLAKETDFELLYQEIARTEVWIDDMYYGYGGDLINEPAIALQEILERPDARDVYLRLLNEATLTGQLYALCGLRRADKAAFDKRVDKYLDSTNQVVVISADVETYMTAKEIAQSPREDSENAKRVVLKDGETLSQWRKQNLKGDIQSYRIDIMGGGYSSLFLDWHYSDDDPFASEDE